MRAFEWAQNYRRGADAVRDPTDIYRCFGRGEHVSDEELAALVASAKQAITLCDLFQPGVGFRSWFFSVWDGLVRVQNSRRTEALRKFEREQS